jgi:serine phosphatase RsbU (regulator of sigma subunit)/Tfp pilus assembly protein PilF
MKLARIFFPILFSASLCAQTSKIDSLLTVLNTSIPDTTRANVFSSLAIAYFKGSQFEKSQEYYEKAMKLSKDLNFNQGIADAWSIGGMLEDANSNFELAIEKYDKALDLYEKNADIKKIAIVHQDKANAYYSMGANDKALLFYMKSLKVREQLGDSSGIASSYMGISNVYSQMHRSDLSLLYAKKALRLKEKYGEKKMVSWLLNNVGAILIEMGDTINALPYYEKSLALKKELNDEYGLATTYKNIGSILLKEKKFDLALDHYRRALELMVKLNPDDEFQIAICYDDIGAAYSDMGKYDSAVYYVNKAIVLAEKVGSHELLRLPYYNMAQVLYRKGDYKPGYEYLYKHLIAKDSTLSSETNALMTEMAAKYENEKKEQQIAIQELEINDQKKIKKFLSAMVLLGFLLTLLGLLLTIVLYKGYKNKKKANELLADKNNLIEQQKLIVELKNKDITDSIHYAQRIQNAILPSSDYQKKLIPESFILFKPKDIVSGDFYWMERWGNKTIVAIVDCTGHGVPGAFMTFVAYSLLNEAVLEHGIDNPAAILNELRRNLDKMLRQKNENVAIKDGMDISICVFDFNKMIVEYAGAYNPLWIISNNELKEIKADKQPVGVITEQEPRSYTNHTVEMKKGDAFYLFTDGYADQFGGSSGKKFKYKTLKELLLSVNMQPAEEQKKVLDKTFEDWRGKLEQVDDICIFGVRI